MAINATTLADAILAALDAALGAAGGAQATSRASLASSIASPVASAHNADSSGGGLPAVHTLATRPAAGAAYRGSKIIISDATYQGGSDIEQTCLMGSGGTYAWVDTSQAAS